MVSIRWYLGCLQGSWGVLVGLQELQEHVLWNPLYSRIPLEEPIQNQRFLNEVPGVQQGGHVWLWKVLFSKKRWSKPLA